MMPQTHLFQQHFLRTVILLTAVVIASLAVGEVIRPDAPGRIQMMLRRTSDAQPLRGIRVKLDNAMAVTDFGGVAVFPVLSSPPRQLRIQDMDYLWVDRPLTAQEQSAAAIVTVDLAPITYAEVAVKVALKRTADPLAGVHVVMNRVGPSFAPVRVEGWTGFDGTFQITGLPAGQFEVDVTAVGCKPLHTTCDFAEGKGKLDVELEPDAGVAKVGGTVADKLSGQRIAGAEVTVVHASQGELTEKPLAAARTGADGAFAMDQIPRGLRRIMSGAAPADVVLNSLILRVSAKDYLDGFLAVQLDGQTASATARQIALYPRQGIIEERPGNDAPEKAQDIVPTCALRLGLKGDGKPHYFRLDLPVDGLLSVNVPDCPTAVYLKLHQGPNNATLAEAGFPANKPMPWQVPLRAGTYLLNVAPWGTNTPAPGVEFTIDFQSIVEPHPRNDQMATPVEVIPGERFHGFEFPADDQNYYIFRVGSAGSGRLVTSALPIDRYNRVLNDEGKTIAEAGVQPDQPNTVDFAIVNPGTFYLQVGPWGGSKFAMLPFLASLDFVPCDANEQKGRNDTIPTATPVPLDGFACGTIDPVDDVDYYRLRIDESGSLIVSLSATPLDRYLRVQDGAGGTIAEMGIPANKPGSMIAFVRKRGTYYVQISSWGGGRWNECPYLLRTAFYPNDPRDRHDNGTPPNASIISVATLVAGDVGFEGDLDHYRLFVPRRAVLHSHYGPTSIGRYLRVLDPTGASISEMGLQANNGGDLHTQVQKPGWQVLVASSWGGGWAREPYRLWHDIDLEDAAEPNNELSRATPLPARASISGTVLPEADADLFACYLDRKDRYRFTCTATDLARYLRVLDTSGKTLAEAGASIGKDVMVEWESPAPGPVLLKVEGWGGGASPQHYSVHFQPVKEATPPVARLSFKQDPADRHKVTFTPSAAGPAPITSYEVDLNGTGAYESKSATAAAVETTYPGSGWVTARLRVSDASGYVGYDFATFNTRDPKEDETGVQAEFISPTPGSVVDEMIDVEALAWRADGGAVGEMRLMVDADPAARWLVEPYTTQLDPLRWAGKTVELRLVTGGAKSGVVASSKVAVPSLLKLLPADQSLLTSAAVTFTWETPDESPSQVVVTKPDGGQVTFEGPAGKRHRVAAQGLQQDSSYTWIAKSGDRTSTPRTFRLVRGIEFIQRDYKFEIARDYDQRGAIGVVNHGEAPERLKLHVGSEQEDLLVSFVGEGSPDKVIELGPNEHRELLLAFSAQDVMQEQFAFPITLEGLTTGSEVHKDISNVNVKVRMPRVDFEAKVLSQDPGTLACEVEVENRAEKITDFSVRLDGPAAARAYLSPAVHHATLDAGGRLRFHVVPLLSDPFHPFDVTVVMKGIQVEKKLPQSFALPAGKKVFFASIDPVQETTANAQYCTNRPVVGTQLTVPNGAQIGNPVNVGPGGSSAGPRDLNALYNKLLQWIHNYAANAKNEKQMLAILNAYLRNVDGKIVGDPRAAMLALTESLRDAARGELSDWERYVADTAGATKDDWKTLLANSTSNISDIGTAASAWSSIKNINAVNDLAALSKASQSLQVNKLGTVADLMSYREDVRQAYMAMKNLLQAVKTADPKNLQMLADIQTGIVKAGREIDKIDDVAKKIKMFTTTFNQAAAATEATAEEASRMSRASNALTGLSFVMGSISRYDALTSQGYPPGKAAMMAVGQSAVYNTLTSMPAVAVADLTLTLAQNGVEWAAPDARVLGVKPTELSLSNTVDIGVTLIDFASTSYGRERSKDEVRAFLNGMPMERVRQMMDRIREMRATASSPEEAAKLAQLRELMNEVLTEKEADP